MFNHGEIESPYFYEEPVIAFAATYKYYDIPSFLIKWECILMRIDFFSAKIQIESEHEGQFEFFWKSKDQTSHFYEKDKMIETDQWYFGIGYRDMWGFLLEDLTTSKSLFHDLGFTYPIQFDKYALNQLNSMILRIKEVSMQKVIDIEDFFKDKGLIRSNKIYILLLLLEWKRFIDFGRKKNGGYWIKKLKNSEKITKDAQSFIQKKLNF